MIIEWALVAAVLFGAMIFCARIMRRGLTTLDEDRRQYLERIHAEESKIEEDRRNMSSLEHLRIMKAAVEDLLRLEGNPEGHALSMRGRSLVLATPQGEWRIELVMRERALKSTGRTLHGKSRWQLASTEHVEEHDDPASLMRSLAAQLRGGERRPTPEPPHLAARVGGLAVARRAQ